MIVNYLKKSLGDIQFSALDKNYLKVFSTAVETKVEDVFIVEDFAQRRSTLLSTG